MSDNKRQSVDGKKIVVVWDPELVSEEDYKELIVAVAQLVQANGAAGVERIDGGAAGATVEVGVYS